MGSSHVQGSGRAGGFSALAAIGAVAAFLHAIAAHAEMPAPRARGPGFTGAVGSVIEFQEAAGARILYFEEKGGLLMPVAPVVPGSRRDDLPPVAASAGAPAGAAAASAAAARKAAPAAARP